MVKFCAKESSKRFGFNQRQGMPAVRWGQLYSLGTRCLRNRVRLMERKIPNLDLIWARSFQKTRFEIFWSLRMLRLSNSVMENFRRRSLISSLRIKSLAGFKGAWNSDREPW